MDSAQTLSTPETTEENTTNTEPEMNQSMNPFANVSADKAAVQNSIKVKQETESAENEAEVEKELQLHYPHKHQVVAVQWKMVSQIFTNHVQVKEGVLDPEQVTIQNPYVFVKFDTAIKVNAATNKYFFMSSVPLQASNALVNWFKQQKQQASTKNKRYGKEINSIFCVE